MSNQNQRHAELKCNEDSKIILLQALVRWENFVRFSYIDGLHAFPRFTTTYQLRKALNQLIEAGFVETGFKGHNRYGYTIYRATGAGHKRVGGYLEATAAFEKWKNNLSRGEFE